MILPSNGISTPLQKQRLTPSHYSHNLNNLNNLNNNTLRTWRTHDATKHTKPLT
ncbi:hypothetical protein XF_0548 [Xylella fastidiosa 9a5c]|uniref:Uncharacterized protein n=1 Tax=Xylella fastidiosa (strain 9a5c) TaxID=160492 RepID=Q9PFV9_XYLFA|nr:hypothetical protein XF_0548 [Xylella fastidiosa 9a5c]